MRSSRTFSMLLLLALLGLFGWGLVELLLLRFEKGDVYPPYSTFRADPLGSKAFHAGLDSLDTVSARRSLQPISRISDPRGTTLLFLGSSVTDLDGLEPTVKDFESFVAGGGRLVVAFSPFTAVPYEERRRLRREAKSEIEPKKKSEKTEPREQRKVRRTDEFDECVSCDTRWGFELAFAHVPHPDEARTAALTGWSDATTKGNLSWHSILYFDNLDKSWSVIASCEKRAVLIERKLGAGTIVLCADSYLFSNEAMRQERHAGLLAWVIGRNQKAVFDETHLGVQEDPGVVTLARKYGLQTTLGSLVLLAGLFIWKSASRFVPPYEETLGNSRRDLALGRDAASGLVNLLRRTISPQNILDTCVGEWKKSFARGKTRHDEKLGEIGALLSTESARPRKERNPVRTYQQICEMLARKK